MRVPSAVVVICAALTRMVDWANAYGDTGFGFVVATVVRSRVDLAIWAVSWLAIAALLWVGLYA